MLRVPRQRVAQIVQMTSGVVYPETWISETMLQIAYRIVKPGQQSTGLAGLRWVIDQPEVEKVIAVLTGEVSDMPKNWHRRFKYNWEKIKTGDVFELAEVLRNLAIREWERGLSTGEKQMYTRAKKILASEFMYALDKDEDGAEEYLDQLLEERFGAEAAA